MADSSLDDFFAKKDKSKKKSKSKSQALGDGDDVTKSDKKVKKTRDKDQSSTGGLQNSSNANLKEDEEWKDFEEEKEVDYTGLRIQNMQIAKEEQERQEREDAEDEKYDEDGEVRDRRDGASGPWNKGGEPVKAPVKAAPEPVKQEEAPAPKTSGKYVPPSMRNQSSMPASSVVSHRRKKEAPNLQSEEDFPTLGGGPAPAKWGYNSSASSDLIENPNQRRGGNLTLENKFSALQD